jgi:hypothetical protein
LLEVVYRATESLQEMTGENVMTLPSAFGKEKDATMTGE